VGPQPISATAEASDFKFGTQYEFGFTFAKHNFRTKYAGSELGQYTPPKIETPICATVEANNFKLGHNLDLERRLST